MSNLTDLQALVAARFPGSGGGWTEQMWDKLVAILSAGGGGGPMVMDYGPGTDGAVVRAANTFDGNDLYATTYQIMPAKTVVKPGAPGTGPFCINANVSMQIDGTIDASGANGANGANGAGGAGGAGGVAIGAAAGPCGNIGGSGGSGGPGAMSDDGNPGGNPQGCPQFLRGPSASGSVAASGGDGGNSSTGTGGPMGTDDGLSTYVPRLQAFAMGLGLQLVFDAMAGSSLLMVTGLGGCGGGGGGGGGAGGTSGGLVILRSPSITISLAGTINASGGAGGHGGNAQAASNPGGGGGGGGGSGGQIILVCETLSVAGTLAVSAGGPGAGGAKNGTGVAGAIGLPGADGEMWHYQPSTGIWTAL